MRFLKSLFCKTGADGDKDDRSAAPREDVAADHDILDDGDPRIDEGYAVMARFWDAIGKSDADVITYLINPQFQGAPPWPGIRQAYRIVRRANSLILSSDGMSDPFIGTSMLENGFGMEVWLEVPGMQAADFGTIRASWAFDLIERVAQNVADLSGITDRLAKFGVMSMALPGVEGLPEGWVDEDGMAGVMIGLPAPYPRHVVMPFTPVQMVPVTLLRADELAVAATGREARNDLVARLAKGSGHLSDLGRSSAL